MLLAGLDIGTTGCKISIYESTGAYLGRVYRAYPAIRTKTAHEIDAGVIWLSVQNALREASAAYPGIIAIGITSFGETFVMLDEHDMPLCPAMLYTDPRGEIQCARLIEALGEKYVTDITGVKPCMMYSLPKLMWIKENWPKVYANTKRILLMEDYIVYLLTGKAQIDYSLAARTMGFDIHMLMWSNDIFSAAEIDQTLFSAPVAIGTSAGSIKPDIAEMLGLPAGTLIVSVSHDQVAAAIGSGVFDESCAVDGAGTVECITPVFSSFDTQAMAAGNYAVIPYITPGKFVCYAFTYTSGALVQWFVDNLAGLAAQSSDANKISIYTELENRWNGMPTGLLVLPHFAGAATPYMDAGSKGAITGLTLANTRQDIYMAIMEGVCYEMRLNMERLAQAHVPVCRLRTVGGGANSRVWMQMKADIMNVPVTALRSCEAGATGSAMLAGVAADVFQNLHQANRLMVAECETFYPRREAYDAYSVVYERYKKLYQAIRPLA